MFGVRSGKGIRMVKLTKEEIMQLNRMVVALRKSSKRLMAAMEKVEKEKAQLLEDLRIYPGCGGEKSRTARKKIDSHK